MKKANVLGVAFVACVALSVWAYLTDSELDPEFQQWIEQEREHPPESENAFLYLMGIGCPEGVDPLDAGRAAFKKVQIGEAEYLEIEDSLKLPDREHLAGLLASESLPQILLGQEEVSELLNEHREVLARYQKVTEYPSFSMLTQPSIEEEWPQYRYILVGQQLIQLQALEKIVLGQLNSGVDVLLNDLSYHRRMLSKADNLVSKMIAIIAVTQSVKLLHGVDKLVGLKDHHRQNFLNHLIPLSDKEYDLSKAYQREAILGRNILLDLTKMPLWDGPKEQGWSLSEAVLMRFFLKPNHASNMALKQWRAVLELSQLPASDFYMVAEKEITAIEPSAWDRFFNPVGTIMVSIGVPRFEDYVARTHDLDCLLGLARASVKSATTDQITQQGEVNPYNGSSIILDNNVAYFDGPLDEYKGGRSLRVAW